MSDEDLSEYFPLPKVVDGIFNLCSQLFDVEFSEVDCEGGWNPDVKLFAIRDLKSDQILGHFYLDAYLREEKGYAGGLKSDLVEIKKFIIDNILLWLFFIKEGHSKILPDINLFSMERVKLRKNQNLMIVCQTFTGMTYLQFFWPYS